MKDLDTSYVELLNRWQTEDRRAERLQRDRRLQDRVNKIGSAVIAAMFVLTLIIAYGGV